MRAGNKTILYAATAFSVYIFLCISSIPTSQNDLDFGLDGPFTLRLPSSNDTVDETSDTLQNSTEDDSEEDVIDDEQLSMELKKYNKVIRVRYVQSISSFLGPHMIGPPPKCPVSDNCILDEKVPESEADALIWHAPHAGGDRRIQKAFPTQKLIVMSMESEEIYTVLKDREWMKQFDYTMTYRLNSDILSAYFTSDPAVWRRTPKNKTETALLYIASNCGARSNRDAIVKEIKKTYPVHSYGSCLHNTDWPTGGRGDKPQVMAKYKFYLAFESHEAIDYVTEKLFHPLYMGTVPVYLGAPNVYDFLPSNDSIILYRSFKSTTEFIERIKYLLEHEEEYERHLEWKKRRFPDEFQALLDRQKLDARCRDNHQPDLQLEEEAQTWARVSVDGEACGYRLKNGGTTTTVSLLDRLVPYGVHRLMSIKLMVRLTLTVEPYFSWISLVMEWCECARHESRGLYISLFNASTVSCQPTRERMHPPSVVNQLVKGCIHRQLSTNS
ncbi:alpha 1,3 fucosyltransferase [Planoprotostelium fungivorum]|uniref:Fucosyltransferase n=1 Tax=Planoprotostelium fungivorum TaxID=1890364 RepID=A0A2P6NBL6_9EUKA|nr:alpha 1,3 fucosyltransferase [Planoprotostelium fungivorum]